MTSSAADVFIHVGDLPGYAASHGCIPLPQGLTKKLYGVTQIGTPVMITDQAQIAEQGGRAAEYQRAKEEYARRGPSSRPPPTGH